MKRRRLHVRVVCSQSLTLAVPFAANVLTHHIGGVAYKEVVNPGGVV